nr:hypothetical protein [Tanacetum cinerariifolium]
MVAYKGEKDLMLVSGWISTASMILITVIFRIMLHGGYFEYWKAGLVVVIRSKQSELKRSKELFQTSHRGLQGVRMVLAGNIEGDVLGDGDVRRDEGGDSSGDGAAVVGRPQWW